MTYEELMAKSRALAQAGNIEAAKRAADMAQRMQGGGQVAEPAPQTNLLEQGMSGVNEGIAGALGFPVDAVTSAINAGVRGINKVAGTDIGTIDDPIGGSGSFERLLAPTISDVQPQTAGQRFGRRIGQEVGYGAVAAPVMMAAPVVRAATQTPQAVAQYLAANTASDIGAGVGGATAREIAPDSNLLDIVMSLGGGMGTAAGISASSKSRPPAPTLDEVQARKAAGYSTVENSGVMLTPEGRDALAQSVGSAVADAKATNPRIYPRAHEGLSELSQKPHQLWSVEEQRQWIGDQVAGNADESRVGVAMKNAIDDFLDVADQSQLRDGNIPADEALAALQDARSAARTEFKALDVLEAQRAGESRAATSGTGGNVLNTQSQNIRRLYDKAMDLRKKGKPTGYTPDEIAQMERIIFPDRVQQNLRRVGRLSPTSGALMTSLGAAATGGGVTAAALSGNPAALLATAPSAVGMIAQGLAERAKKKDIAELVDIILRGGTKVTPKPNEALKAAIAAQLLSSTDAGPR